jgi:hypothetical protein
VAVLHPSAPSPAGPDTALDIVLGQTLSLHCPGRTVQGRTEQGRYRAGQYRVGRGTHNQKGQWTGTGPSARHCGSPRATFDVESQINQGTAFTIYLPLHAVPLSGEGVRLRCHEGQLRLIYFVRLACKSPEELVSAVLPISLNPISTSK